MSDRPKLPEPRMEFRPVSWVGRAALARLKGVDEAARRFDRGPIRNNQVPVVMPDGHEPMENDDEGREID